MRRPVNSRLVALLASLLLGVGLLYLYLYPVPRGQLPEPTSHALRAIEAPLLFADAALIIVAMLLYLSSGRE